MKLHSLLTYSVFICVAYQAPAYATCDLNSCTVTASPTSTRYTVTCSFGTYNGTAAVYPAGSSPCVNQGGGWIYAGAGGLDAWLVGLGCFPTILDAQFGDAGIHNALAAVCGTTNTLKCPSNNDYIGVPLGNGTIAQSCVQSAD